MSEGRDYDIRALFGQDGEDDDEPIPGNNPGPEEEEEEADPEKTVLPEAVRVSAKKKAVAPEKKAKRLAEELSEMRFEKDKLKKLHEYSEAEQSKKREPEKKKKKAEQTLPPKEKEEMDEPPSAPKEKKVAPEKSKIVPDKKLVSDKKAAAPEKKAAPEKNKLVPDKKAAPEKSKLVHEKKVVPDKKAVSAVAASEEKVLPLFPHIGDMERADAMLALAVEDAWRSRLPEGDSRRLIRDELGNSEKALQFNERCKTFSKQLQTALITFFNGKKNAEKKSFFSRVLHGWSMNPALREPTKLRIRTTPL